MNKFQKFALTIPFCVALAAPVMIAAQDHDRDDRTHRYYDEEHRDYHDWNSGEQRYWREYWTSERQPYVEWDRASDEQHRAYWRWRHEHMRHHDRDDHDHDRDHD